VGGGVLSGVGGRFGGFAWECVLHCFWVWSWMRFWLAVCHSPWMPGWRLLFGLRSRACDCPDVRLRRTLPRAERSSIIHSRVSFKGRARKRSFHVIPLERISGVASTAEPQKLLAFVPRYAITSSTSQKMVVSGYFVEIRALWSMCLLLSRS